MSGAKPFRCEANGKDNRSRVMREYYARFCENLGLKYPGLLDSLVGIFEILFNYSRVHSR